MWLQTWHLGYKSAKQDCKLKPVDRSATKYLGLIFFGWLHALVYDFALEMENSSVLYIKVELFDEHEMFGCSFVTSWFSPSCKSAARKEVCKRPCVHWTVSWHEFLGQVWRQFVRKCSSRTDTSMKQFEHREPKIWNWNLFGPDL